MKKKLIILTSIFTILCTSFSHSVSPVISPYIIGGVITHLGTMALKGFNLATSAKDVFEMGNYVYSKLTFEEKEKLNNAYNNDASEFEDLSHDLISKIENEKYDYHYFNSPKSLIVDNYNDNYPMVNKIISVQYDFKYGCSYYNNYGSPIMYFYYDTIEGTRKVANVRNCIGDSTCSIRKDKELYYQFNSDGFLVLGCKHDNSFVGKTVIQDIYIDTSFYSCSNCPHYFTYSDIPKIKFEGITQEQKDFITENYPNNSIDIEKLPPNYNPNINQGGNQGSSIPSSPPPSFPNLQEFDFSGLELEPITNIFENFKTKFPFSIPFDLFNLITGFVADPIAPIFEVDILGSPLVLDLTEFEELANIIRMFVLLGYSVSLMFITKRFGG